MTKCGEMMAALTAPHIKKKTRTCQLHGVIRVFVAVAAVHALSLLRVGIEPVTLRTISLPALLLLLVVRVRCELSLTGLVR